MHTEYKNTVQRDTTVILPFHIPTPKWDFDKKINKKKLIF